MVRCLEAIRVYCIYLYVFTVFVAERAQTRTMHECRSGALTPVRAHIVHTSYLLLVIQLNSLT
jgi:hypothetical protein